MLKEPQVNCPVRHIFGPGVYIREVTFPAGTLVVGRFHKHTHLNVFVKGKIAVLAEDGTVADLVAPLTFLAPPGRKVAFVREDVVWQNVYNLEETDVAKIESIIFEDSAPLDEAKAEAFKLLPECPEAIADFAKFLKESGFTAEEVRRASEIDTDLTNFFGVTQVVVEKSKIEGLGLFASDDMGAGTRIPARVDGCRTPAGRYTNHSNTPNVSVELLENGDINWVVERPIQGMRGGLVGEEITVNYREVLKLNPLA